MKLYRRELLDQQILKLKQEKGIIDENPLDNLDMEMSMDSGIGLAEPLASVQQISSTAVEQNGNNGGDDDDDEDDWSFMNRSTRSKNSLFIDDDDDDLYTTPSTHPQTLQTTSSIQQQQQNTTISTAASNELPDFSDFSDEETKILLMKVEKAMIMKWI